MAAKDGDKIGVSNDIMSPYYIGPSDNPSHVYVTDLLNDGNYGDWSEEISNCLLAKNKFGFVDGTIPEPDKGSTNLLLWRRCNAMVKGWFLVAMEKEIRNSVKHAKTAQEIWKDLEERFGKESAPKAYELKRNLTMTRQERLSVSAYYTKLKGIWDEIDAISATPRCTCGNCTCDMPKLFAEKVEKERIYEFLMGLDDTFSTIRSQVLSMTPLPSLGVAYHLIAEDERQRLITSARQPVVDGAAFQISRQGTSGRHENSKENTKTPPQCGNCGKLWHTIETCYEIVGYPENRRNKSWKKDGGRTVKKQQPQPRAAHVDSDSATGSNVIQSFTIEQLNQLKEYLNSSAVDPTPSPSVNMAGKNIISTPWIIDSGATEHIAHEDNLYASFTKDETGLPVKVPNGEKASVTGIGSVELPNGISVDHVLHVPDFQCNLLSVSRLTKELNCALIFFSDGCLMQDLASKSLIGAGKQRDGLYLLEPVCDSRQAFGCVVDAEVWHRRLGHASGIKLQGICEVADSVCESCMRAKQTRITFPSSSIQTRNCFELLHCDIWGGYKTASFSGAYYFLTIVDDFSRGVWVYLMKFKSEVSKYLKLFCNMVKTQFGKIVKRIRTDNGGEFQSNEMMSYYMESGILLETSCVHTPQQNGVVERRHRYILEMARALRFQANLPINFWGECVLTAVYLINRLPSKVLQNRTPYEILLKKKPNYEHLRVFGCMAFAKDTSKVNDKFAERGRKCIFVGYPHGQKGYKVYDLKSRRMYTSRDVKFFENLFPYILPNEDKVREKEDDNIAGKELHNVDGHEEVSSVEEVGVEEVVVSEGGNGGNQDQRRSERTRRQPAHLQEYEVDLPSSIDHTQPASDEVSSTVHPLSNFVTYDQFSPAHKCFLASIDAKDEPRTFSQAAKVSEWRDAMRKEIEALEANGTWDLVELPAGKSAIDSKWVYKIKYKPTGEIERYKARLVAKGFTQVPGIDFHETFAPVAKLVTMRCLLTIGVKKNWIIHQLDVNNAFLHGDLHEDVYMKIPQGYAREGDARVCRLRKSLYGLRQASRNWYHKFTGALVSIGFKQSKADHSLFTFRRGESFVGALIYVDDVLLAGNDEKKIQYVKDFLDKKFSIKDLGPLKYFLGIEVARSALGMVLTQRKYALDILKDSGMEGCRPSAMPMEQNIRLDLGDKSNDESPAVDSHRYRRLIGRLLYLTVTRPDIQYATNILSQFLSSPKQIHYDAALRVIRYVKGTVGQGIFLPVDGELSLDAYCDSDWGGCPMTRRSRSGYLIKLGGAPVSWRTKKQSVVSRSSAEAEYRAMASTVSEIIWLRWLLDELGVRQHGPTRLYCDNQAARHIARNPVFHERTKHVEMDCYFVRERVESREVEPCSIATSHQIADIFTKALGSDQLRFLAVKLGVRNLHLPT